MFHKSQYYLYTTILSLSLVADILILYPDKVLTDVSPVFYNVKLQKKVVSFIKQETNIWTSFCLLKCTIYVRGRDKTVPDNKSRLKAKANTYVKK